MIFTVFPVDFSELPQDFPTYEYAVSYGLENFGDGAFCIESTTGDCV